jgi:hypothetical protein
MVFNSCQHTSCTWYQGWLDQQNLGYNDFGYNDFVNGEEQSLKKEYFGSAAT